MIAVRAGLLWARPTLCDTVRYYRTFQSAAYLHGYCYRMLFDKQGSDPDVMTDLVLRGGMSKVDSDHAVVQALQRCMKQKLAVILCVAKSL
ncbi:MAG: hypothetical protein M1826_000737 [Phylliscum demangeonii]|nr:MAG: hypothetical protein M1826_000737 [Phylliscum demangeonii]